MIKRSLFFLWDLVDSGGFSLIVPNYYKRQRELERQDRRIAHEGSRWQKVLLAFSTGGFSVFYPKPEDLKDR